MATQYPLQVDTTTTLPYIVNGNRADASDINRLRDAVVSIQTEIGASPSATFTTVADRLTELESLVASSAPDSAQYLVLSANVSLTDERVFTPGAGISVLDGGAGGAYSVYLSDSGVVAGSYRQPAFDVDQYGRITAVDDGTFAGAAGSYKLATIEVDGYGRLVSATAGATDGYAGKLAFWQSDSVVTYDGYIDVVAGKVIFAEDLYCGIVRETEALPGMFASAPKDYAVFTSSAAPIVISSNDNDGVLIGSNLGGVTGLNSNTWNLQIFDGNRSIIINKTAGSSTNVYSPTATMLDSGSTYTLGIAGWLALASGTDNDGYGSAIEAEESLAVTALGDKLLLLSNNAAGEAAVSIGSINGNGPAASANWYGRYSDDSAHVTPTAEFVRTAGGYTQLRMGSTGDDGFPQYAFMDAPTTGMYFVAPDQIAFAAAGGKSASIDSSYLTSIVPILGPGGNNPIFPAFGFDGDTSTGMYQVAAGQIGFALDGYAALIIDPEYMAGLAQGQYLDGGPTIKLFGGTASTPTYGFYPDLSSGMYRAGADQLGFSAAGSMRARISSTGLAVIDGTVDAPSVSFVSDASTGIFRPAQGQLAIACDGYEILNVSDGYIYSERNASWPSISSEADFEVGTGLDAASGIVLDAATVKHAIWAPNWTFAQRTLYIDNLKPGMKLDVFLINVDISVPLVMIIKARETDSGAYTTVLITYGDTDGVAVSSFSLSASGYYRFSVYSFGSSSFLASI